MSSRKNTVRPDDEALDLADLEAGDDGEALAGLDDLAALEGDAAADPDDPVGALDLDYDALTNEEVTQRETSAVLEAFKARARAEKARFELATDSEYWVAVCFQTRAQKEAFLQAAQLLRHGDKYIDGARLAKAMGIELPLAQVPYNTSSRIDPKLAALVKDL